MPKNTEIKSILIIGAGPIVIGQACEFDYSGTQACRALKDEGYKTILINSNPATIMTDQQTADRTYIEPITPEVVEKIIIKERPDAILPTVGGQTALNCALSLEANGVLEKYGVKMIGADSKAIRKAEDRELFNKAMAKIGLEVPKNAVIHPTTCQPIQSMTNAVKNSTSRSAASLPVVGVLSRFLYEQLTETGALSNTASSSSCGGSSCMGAVYQTAHKKARPQGNDKTYGRATTTVPQLFACRFGDSACM